MVVKELTRCDWCRTHVTCAEHGTFLPRPVEPGYDWVCRCCLEKGAVEIAQRAAENEKEGKSGGGHPGMGGETGAGSSSDVPAASPGEGEVPAFSNVEKNGDPGCLKCKPGIPCEDCSLARFWRKQEEEGLPGPVDRPLSPGHDSIKCTRCLTLVGVETVKQDESDAWVCIDVVLCGFRNSKAQRSGEEAGIAGTGDPLPALVTTTATQTPAPPPPRGPKKGDPVAWWRGAPSRRRQDPVGGSGPVRWSRLRLCVPTRTSRRYR